MTWRICAGVVTICTYSCDVLEQRNEVDFLLKVRTKRRAALLTHKRYHGLMIPFGVVQTGQQMHGSRARRREADADLATELGVAAGHERGRFLVSRLDERDPFGGTVERADDAVDAVTGIAVDATHAPSHQARDEGIGNGVGHDSWVATPKRGIRALLRLRYGLRHLEMFLDRR